MSKHGIGIIGFGVEGAWHAHQVDISEVFDLVGVSDIRQERRDFAVEKGFRLFASTEALLQDENIDIVIIATPNDTHKDLSIAAMQAGKHVICEKPAAMSTADFDEITACAERCGKLFTVYQNRRWDGDFLAVSRIIENNRIGDIARIESRIHGSRGIPADWRMQKEHGGGVIWEWGVHVFDQILLLKDQVKLSYISAVMTHLTTEEVEDGFTAMLSFADGTEALIEVSTNNYICMPRWYLTGKTGTALVKDWSTGAEITTLAPNVEDDIVVPVRAGTGITRVMAPRRPSALQKKAFPLIESNIHDYYRNASDAIDGKTEPFVTKKQLRRVLQVMEAARNAAETHQTVFCNL